MNEIEFKGMWNQLKGQIQKQWGKLTDDDIAQVNGQRQILLGRLQERYGKNKAELEKELDGFLDRMKSRTM